MGPQPPPPAPDTLCLPASQRSASRSPHVATPLATLACGAVTACSHSAPASRVLSCQSAAYSRARCESRRLVFLGLPFSGTNGCRIQFGRLRVRETQVEFTHSCFVFLIFRARTTRSCPTGPDVQCFENGPQRRGRLRDRRTCTSQIQSPPQQANKTIMC